MLGKEVTKFLCSNKRFQKRLAEKFMDSDNAKTVKMNNIGELGG
jgi:hypothetical protein